jgi:hypothetical protein
MLSKKINRVVKRLRTSALIIGGVTCVDYGVWQLSHIAGWVTIGVSLFVLEWLTEDEEPSDDHRS